MHDLDIRKLRRNVKVLETLESEGSLAPELAYKFALMECCGWIEEKMHQMLFDYVERKTADVILKETVKKAITNTNYSFRYSEFRDKFVAALGELAVQEIESYVENYDDSYFNFEHFKQLLTELKKKRDACAHTYTKAGMVTAFGFTELEQKLKVINMGINIIQAFIRRR